VELDVAGSTPVVKGGRGRRHTTEQRRNCPCPQWEKKDGTPHKKTGRHVGENEVGVNKNIVMLHVI